jgi:hypothetical protein
MSLERCIIDAVQNSELQKEAADKIKDEVKKIRQSKLTKAEKKVKLEELKKDKQKIGKIAKGQKLRNMKNLSERFRESSEFKNKIEAVTASLYGSKFSNKRRGRLNANTLREVIKGKYETMFHKGMDDIAGLKQVLDDEKARIDFGLEFLKAMRDEATDNQMAIALAKTAKKIDELRVKEKANAGVLDSAVNNVENRTLTTVNDPIKMLKVGQTEWVTDRIEAMGEEAIKNNPKFSNVLDDNGQYDKVKAEKAFADIYNEITRNYNGYIPFDLQIEYNPKGAISNRARVLSFKDANAEFNYHKKYGKGPDIIQQLYEEYNSDAYKIAEADFFGGKFNFNKYLSLVEASITDSKERAKFTAKRKDFETQYDAAFGRLGGTSELALIGETFRTFNSMIDLSLVAATAAPTDIYKGISNIAGRKRQNFFKASAEYFKGLGASLDKNKRESILKGMDFVMHGSLDGMAGRITDDNNYVPGALQRLNAKYYKYNFLNLITNMTRSMATRARVIDISNNVKLYKSVDDMPDAEKADFRNFGITDADLVELKKGLTKLKEYDNLEVITNDNLRAAGVDPAVVDKFSIATRHEVNNSTLQKSGLQTAQLYGSNPNSALGVFLRTAFQYKDFALATGRSFASDVYTNLGQESGLLNAAKQQPKFISQMMMFGVMFGYSSIAAKSILRGQEPPDPLDPQVILRSLIVSGMLGFYGDVMFQEYDKAYISLAGTLLGPNVQLAGDVLSAIWKARDGLDESGAALWRILDKKVSRIALVGTSLDYLILRDINNMINPETNIRRFQRFAEDPGLFNENRSYFGPGSPTVSAGIID